MPLQDASSCHHCHIHSPIPSEDLKRTHPLRSSQINKPHDSISSRSHDIARGFKKNVSFLYGKIQKRDARSAAKETQGNGSIPSPPPPPLPQHIRTVDLPPVVVVEKPVSRATITTVQTPVLGALTLSPGRCVPITSTALPPSPASSTPPPIPPPLRDARSRRKGGVGMAGVQTAVLIGAYALLLVLAVVIGVVISQQSPQRRVRGRPRVGSPIRGASPAPLGDGPIRIGRPRNRPAPRTGRPSAPRPPPPPPPPTTPAPLDYDYVYVDDIGSDITLLPNPVVSNAPPPPPPPPTSAPVFRPLPAPAPRRPAPQPAPSRPPPPRRQNVPLASIDRDFSLQPEDTPRGRKEPDVKILRSWSHQNADGTFSWGYINTDGSFKNETRGLDCVVNGVYGYIDQETGEQLSFPYTSGNPCDPDAPDYYDYDLQGSPIEDFGGPVIRGPVGRPRQG
ncbi:vegetative cell wall protein gp1-like [Penaeus japonicus]|uniref:vegetative cell wall protein gp1-like n=1 Tax=Penaeus japonicus TaxID=27405 RepID=UPI001C713357|nr:vegetative cell wall protein gp1-like [Penaeus japonicus]